MTGQAALLLNRRQKHRSSRMVAHLKKGRRSFGISFFRHRPLQRPAKGVLHGRKQLGNLGDIPLDIALFLQILQFLVSLASNRRPTRGEDAALRNRWCGTCGTAAPRHRGTNHGCIETCPCDNLVNCPGHLGGIRGIGLRAGATFPRNCWRSSVGRASDL